jgi:hypothetical protein
MAGYGVPSWSMVGWLVAKLRVVGRIVVMVGGRHAGVGEDGCDAGGRGERSFWECIFFAQQ